MKYIEEVEKHIIKADEYLKSLIFKLSPLYKKEHGENQDVTVPLFTTLHSTSESILILLLHRSLFDADILLRAVLEGTIKYCYLMIGNDEEKKAKYTEYKVKLTDIDRLNDHKKAIETIDILKKFSTYCTEPLERSILSDEELSRLLKLYPKKEQNKLKRKWSFRKLLESLVESNQEYEAQLGATSAYSLMSHFGHYDWTGVLDRNAQIMDSVNSDSVVYDVIHSMRILSNVLNLELLRVMEYIRGNNFYSQEVLELYKEVYNFGVNLDNLYNELLVSNL